MLKKWLVGLMACAALLGSRGFAAETMDFDQGVGDVRELVRSLQSQVARETAADKAREASWTVMVYINAKNNLEKYGLIDVNEMEKIGSSDKVQIAVELGRIAGYDGSDGDWTGQRRYVIRKDKDASKITSPVLQEIPKADMGDWKHLADFVQWARQKAPAKHYMLIVWNHGSGWEKMRVRDVVINGISYDDETGNHISTQDLGQALASIGKIDIYASDACLMQMAEVGYQIKDYADYIVGSEETEPADGYTYDKLLGSLSAKPAMSAEGLARLAVKSYTDHYLSIRQGATHSAIRPAALPRLLGLLGEWADAVMAANETELIKSARADTQSFAYSANKDLPHFVKLMNAGTKDASVRSKGAQLEDLLAREVIAANAVSADYANAKGLAIYLPAWNYNKDYDELAWAKDGGWAKFVQWQSAIRD